MAAKISTTGELREFLATTLVGVRDGGVKIDEARTIVKLAEKINESYYAELKVALVDIQLGRAGADLGQLAIK